MIKKYKFKKPFIVFLSTLLVLSVFFAIPLKQVDAMTLLLRPSTLSLFVGQQGDIRLECNQGWIMSINTISSSNTSVATVTTVAKMNYYDGTWFNDGRITAVGIGSAIITAVDNWGRTGTASVTVTPLPATGITVSPTSATVHIGSPQQLTSTVSPTSASQTVTWTSSNSAVATVSSTGLVTGVATGTATITARTTDGTNLSAASSVSVIVPPATGITVSPTTASVNIGATRQLTSAVSPTNASQTVTWTSSNPAVATVNATGLVTGVAAGTSTITARTADGTNLSATSVVTVLPPPATGITVSPTTSTVHIGSPQQLTSTVSPTSASQTVTWTSSNSAVATVSSTGLVTGVAAGTATITARTVDGTNLTAVSAITVTAPPATGITVSPTTASVNIGATRQLTSAVSPTNASQTVTWTSSNPAVATVNATGLVTGVAAGTSTITARTADGTNLSAASVITVTRPPATAINVSPTILTVSMGNPRQLTASVTPTAANQTVTWSSSNPAIATVNETGLVTPVAIGTATITATTTDGTNLASNSTITVVQPATGITVTPTNATVSDGRTTQLTATVQPLTAGNRNVTWSSSNTAVATVNAQGLVAGTSPGTATITARSEDGGFTATTAVTVVLVPATGITVTPTTASINAGSNQQFAATLTPADASNPNEITWSTSNSSLARISSSGMLTAIAPGTVTVTATAPGGGVTATATVTITAIPVTRVTVSPTSFTLAVGRTRGILHDVQPLNAGNRTLTWTSSNPAVATVDRQGVVTAVSAGTATITARSESSGLTASTTATITTVPVTAVRTGTPTATVGVGGSRWLTAIVTPSNADNRVRWTSSNPAIARVELNSGRVHGVALGTATITATTVTGNRTATMTVNVVPPARAPIAVSGVTLQPTSITVPVTVAPNRPSARVVPTVAPRNAANRSVTWSSNNPAVATVDARGVITGVAPGNATITVTTVDGGRTATANVTVVAVQRIPLLGIRVTPQTSQVIVGGTRTLAASFTPTNATNRNVTWTSSNPAVATVNARGLVTGVALGTTTITATAADGGHTAVASVTVVQTVAPTSITIAPLTANVNIGAIRRFGITIQPFNADRRVTWTSSNPAVATVDPAGNVRGVALGTATITATTITGNRIATATVTVVPVPTRTR